MWHFQIELWLRWLLLFPVGLLSFQNNPNLSTWVNLSSLLRFCWSAYEMGTHLRYLTTSNSLRWNFYSLQKQGGSVRIFPIPIDFLSSMISSHHFHLALRNQGQSPFHVTLNRSQKGLTALKWNDAWNIMFSDMVSVDLIEPFTFHPSISINNTQGSIDIKDGICRNQVWKQAASIPMWHTYHTLKLASGIIMVASSSVVQKCWPVVCHGWLQTLLPVHGDKTGCLHWGTLEGVRP